MADWMAISPHLLGHPKFRRLRRGLHLNEEQALILLFRMWAFAFDYAPDGDLTQLDEDELAAVFDCENGDGGKTIDVLVRTGFLERSHGRLLIHDWLDYGGRQLYYRATGKVRTRKYRGVQAEEPSYPQDVTVTSLLRDGSDRKIDRKIEDLPVDNSKKPVDNSKKQTEIIHPLDACRIDVMGHDPFDTKH